MKQVLISQLETPSGEPTCSRTTEENCPFLGGKHFGQVYICWLQSETPLERYDSPFGNQMGYLKPGDKCIFNVKQTNKE